MRYEIVQDIIKKAKRDNKKVTIVLDTISGHGGYSEGQTFFSTNPDFIELKDDYIVVNNLFYSHKDLPSFRGQEKTKSRLTFGVEDGNINTAYIEYETIKLIGLN